MGRKLLIDKQTNMNFLRAVSEIKVKISVRSIFVALLIYVVVYWIFGGALLRRELLCGCVDCCSVANRSDLALI